MYPHMPPSNLITFVGYIKCFYDFYDIIKSYQIYIILKSRF